MGGNGIVGARINRHTTVFCFAGRNSLTVIFTITLELQMRQEIVESGLRLRLGLVVQITEVDQVVSLMELVTLRLCQLRSAIEAPNTS